MSDDVRGELLQQIKDKAVVHGKVTLSSGKEADYYIDLRRITLDGEAAPLVGQLMLEITADLDYEAVGGLTLGADPVATSMLHASAARGGRLDSFVVRKAQKAHGMQRRIEGPDIKGRRVLIVEDTSTTGGSPLTAVEAARGRAPRSWRWPPSSTGVPPRPSPRPGCPISRATSWVTSAWAEPGRRRGGFGGLCPDLRLRRGAVGFT